MDLNRRLDLAIFSLSQQSWRESQAEEQEAGDLTSYGYYRHARLGSSIASQEMGWRLGEEV